MCKEEFAKTAEEISDSIENQIILSKSVDNLINDLKVLSEDITYSVSKFELDNIVKKEVDDKF